jgi:hypothetical protein
MAGLDDLVAVGPQQLGKYGVGAEREHVVILPIRMPIPPRFPTAPILQ